MGYMCQLNPYLECDGCQLCYAIETKSEEEEENYESERD